MKIFSKKVWILKKTITGIYVFEISRSQERSHDGFPKKKPLSGAWTVERQVRSVDSIFQAPLDIKKTSIDELASHRSLCDWYATSIS